MPVNSVALLISAFGVGGRASVFQQADVMHDVLPMEPRHQGALRDMVPVSEAQRWIHRHPKWCIRLGKAAQTPGNLKTAAQSIDSGSVGSDTSQVRW